MLPSVANRFDLTPRQGVAGLLRNGGRFPLERVADLRRNEWPIWSGKRIDARASLRVSSQQRQTAPLQVPSTPGAFACAAQTSPTLHSRADACADGHRSHSVSSMPKGNPDLPCPTTHPGTTGFFVMVDQRSNPHVFAPLCARASALVRRLSSIYVFSAHILLRCASWLQSVLRSNAAWSSHDYQRRCVCSGQRPRYNPHRQPLPLHPTL